MGLRGRSSRPGGCATTSERRRTLASQTAPAGVADGVVQRVYTPGPRGWSPGHRDTGTLIGGYPSPRRLKSGCCSTVTCWWHRRRDVGTRRRPLCRSGRFAGLRVRCAPHLRRETREVHSALRPASAQLCHCIQYGDMGGAAGHGDGSFSGRRRGEAPGSEGERWCHGVSLRAVFEPGVAGSAGDQWAARRWRSPP